MINDFSPESLHIHVNIRTKMKRCFSNLYVSGTSVKKRRVKKEEKREQVKNVIREKRRTYKIRMGSTGEWVVL